MRPHCHPLEQSCLRPHYAYPCYGPFRTAFGNSSSALSYPELVFPTYPHPCGHTSTGFRKYAAETPQTLPEQPSFPQSTSPLLPPIRLEPDISAIGLSEEVPPPPPPWPVHHTHPFLRSWMTPVYFPKYHNASSTGSPLRSADEIYISLISRRCQPRDNHVVRCD